MTPLGGLAPLVSERVNLPAFCSIFGLPALVPGSFLVFLSTALDPLWIHLYSYTQMLASSSLGPTTCRGFVADRNFPNPDGLEIECDE